MADSGKQSPLGINVLGSLLSNTGLTINPITSQYVGSSKTNTDYTFGNLVNDTVLRLLTWSINDGYLRGPGNGNATLSNTTFNNLISIGSTSIPALGNSKPSTYIAVDPSGQWTTAGTPATTGYGIAGSTDQGQSASWLPYDTTNTNKSITQWGYLRLHALQAWNEFNWNGASPSSSTPSYKDFCGSFMSANGALNYSNKAITAANNADTFMDGTYSNMNDLTSSDITGVSLSSTEFGYDLSNLGKVINLTRLDAFGLPSILLQQIGKCNAVIQDLSLLLLTSGLSSGEVNGLISGSITRPTVDQEKKIYNAFLGIIGENLTEIMAAIQCYTTGITSLADLLNVKKMFPNSYMTLTVPMYNSSLGLPTNSKTYYLIYTNDGINTALSTTIMNEYVGEQIPNGEPPIGNYSLSPENYTYSQIGFGSYLLGILPNDQAIAAGAFQFSMRQINRITQVEFSKFARAVKGIETMTDLTLINGTSKPTNQDSIDSCDTLLALGSGPYGTYVMSDVLGCMSGLPYPWKLLYDRINQLQNTKLKNIYQQLFLAVTWKQATCTVTYSSEVILGVTYYTPTGFIITDSGGGYGRGTAPEPTITLSNGGTATVTIGTNDLNAGSNGTGQFGRVTTITLLTPGSASTTIPTATIQAPPIDILPVASDGNISTSGTNYPNGTTGWTSPMNAVVQDYIDQANATITDISTANKDSTRVINTYWTILGSQLTIEQRTRFNCIPPVSIPIDPTLNALPTALISFVDSISSYAKDTMPHMAAQTMEAISDLNTVGGQSIVGLMRQERNQNRLINAGIVLENNIPDSLSDMDVKTLTTNGTLENAGVNNSINGYTNPAWASNLIDGVNVSPVPNGRYIPTETALVGTYIPTNGVVNGDIVSMLDGQPNATAAVVVSTGPSDETFTPAQNIITIKTPSQLDPSNVPINLDPSYTGSTLLPASPSPSQAVDSVTTCNCDCWN